MFLIANLLQCFQEVETVNVSINSVAVFDATGTNEIGSASLSGSNYTITTNANYNGTVTLKYNVNDLSLIHTSSHPRVLRLCTDSLPLPYTKETFPSASPKVSTTLYVYNI